MQVDLRGPELMVVDSHTKGRIMVGKSKLRTMPLLRDFIRVRVFPLQHLEMRQVFHPILHAINVGRCTKVSVIKAFLVVTNVGSLAIILRTIGIEMVLGLKAKVVVSELTSFMHYMVDRRLMMRPMWILVC